MSKVITAEEARTLFERKELTMEYFTDAVSLAARMGQVDVTFDSFKHILTPEMEKQIVDLGYTIFKTDKIMNPHNIGEYYYCVSWKK